MKLRRFSRSLIKYPAGALIVIASVFSVSAQSTDAEVNKRPLQDLAIELKADIQEKKLDLSDVFLVEMQGSLNAEGKIEKGSLTVTRREGNVALIEAVNNAILAFNESGYLVYLSKVGAKEISIFVEQDSSRFTARIVSKVESVKRARTISSALNAMLGMARMKKEGPDATEADKRDLLLLQGTEVMSDESKVLIGFKLPSEMLRAILIAELSK